jgi:hypothetical protein
MILILYGSFPPVHTVNPGIMLESATKWISNHTKPLVRQWRASPGLGVLALPHEIILLITSHLNNVSTTSLALTCRCLYSICFPILQTLTKREKVELLSSLERDVAAFYFCHFCVKLHRWHMNWARALPAQYATCMQCLRCMDSRVYLASSWIISYEYARLVMNRHFYGSTHGPSLRILKQMDSYRDSFGVRRTFSHTPCIIDNQPLLKSFIRVSHSQGDPASLRDSIECLGPRVCQHIALAKGRSRLTLVQLPEIVPDGSTPDLFTPCDQSLGSCAFCSTDYIIKISWRGKRKGYVIKVRTCRQLGDCRSPSAWSWHSMSITSGMLINEARISRPSRSKPGCVRDLWYKADGISSKTGGKWVKPLEVLEGRVLA